FATRASRTCAILQKREVVTQKQDIGAKSLSLRDLRAKRRQPLGGHVELEPARRGPPSMARRTTCAARCAVRVARRRGFAAARSERCGKDESAADARWPDSSRGRPGVVVWVGCASRPAELSRCTRICGSRTLTEARPHGIRESALLGWGSK